MKSMRILCTLILTAATLSPSVQAGGLDLILTYGTKYTLMGGTATSQVNDAYAPFYNPAGLMRVEKQDYVINSTTLIFQYEAPLLADNESKTSETSIAPLFYLGGAYRLNDWISLGWAFYPTLLQAGKFTNFDYGIASTDTEYSVQIMRLEAALSLAIRLAPKVFFGVSYRPGYNRLSQTGGIPNALHLSTKVTSFDGKGVKFGVQVVDIGGLTFGATYRPQMGLTLDGTLTAEGPSVAQGGIIVNPGTHDNTLRTSYPAQANFGVSYEIIPDKLTAAFDYSFTENSSLELLTNESELDILSPQGPTDVSSVLQYENGHTFHWGVSYRIAEPWTVGAGFSLDSPVTQPEFASPVLVPAGWVTMPSVGAQYELGRHRFGIAGAYAIAKNHTSEPSPLSPSTHRGLYRLDVYFASVDYQLTF